MLREIIFTCVFALIAADALVIRNSNPDNADANYFKRLPDDVVPVHYNIKLIPYIEEGNFTFDGESSIVLKILRKTRTLSLHELNLTIDEAATTLINSDGNSYTPTNHIYDNVTSILALTFDNELPPEIYHLNMKFVGVLADNEDLHGFYRSSYTNDEGNKVWLATTQFKPSWARQAFPCWDEPALKATFNISIKHHRNYTALSNMPMREQTNDGNEDGMIWTHFETTPIMSTYLVAFVVSDFVRVPNEDGTINMWCRSDLAPHAKFAQEIAAKAGQLLPAYTNTSDEIPKIDHVAIPDFKSTATENWGLITYNEGYFAHEETDGIVHKSFIADSVAQKMVHQWFGNVVSPLWWSEVWLNEGLASFFAQYFLDQMFRDWRIMDFFVVSVQQNTFNYDIDNMESITLRVQQINNPEEFASLFEYPTYNYINKVSSILRMIQHSLSEDVFRQGIIKYLHAHQFGSATSDDLWRALQEALDESDVPHDDYKVKDVMDSWLKQRHYPVVRVTRNYENGDVILIQEHFRPQNDTEYIDDNKWWIPITFATKSNPDFSNTLPAHWLKPHDQNVTIKGIDPNDWIIVNLQAMGYYRVNYDLDNLLKISQYLDSDDYEKIHVLNRAQIIDDVYGLMEAKQLDLTTFLNLAKYLRRETDSIVWESMFRVFSKMIEFFTLPTSSRIKPLLVDMLSKFVESVGYEENPGDDDITKLTRSSALKWACIFGHTECRRMAAIKLREYLADPETQKISPRLNEWTFCSGMMQANVSTWNKFSENYITTTNTSFESLIYYLTYSEDPDIIISFLNKSLAGDSMTDTQRNTFYYAAVDHADNDIILDYFLANINNMVLREYTIQQIVKQLTDNIYSVDRLEKVSNFVKNNYDNEKFEQIETMIDERKAELSDLIAKFPLNEELEIPKN